MYAGATVAVFSDALERDDGDGHCCSWRGMMVTTAAAVMRWELKGILRLCGGDLIIRDCIMCVIQN